MSIRQRLLDRLLLLESAAAARLGKGERHHASIRLTQAAEGWCKIKTEDGVLRRARRVVLSAPGRSYPFLFFGSAEGRKGAVETTKCRRPWMSAKPLSRTRPVVGLRKSAARVTGANGNALRAHSLRTR